jgi:threonylcarbamoyladenosine tRNA methylthiotransferase MtaB
LPFTYLHVFTYSARPATSAALMRDQIPPQLARERNRVLRDLAATKKLAFMRSFIGKRLSAITLKQYGAVIPSQAGRPAAGCTEFTEALSDNYLKIRLNGKWEPNRWLVAKVESLQDGVLLGTPCFERR